MRKPFLLYPREPKRVNRVAILDAAQVSHFVAALSIAAVLLLAIVPVTWAGYSVTPGVVKLMGRQGEALEGSVLVVNGSDKPVRVTVSAENWHARLFGYGGALDDVNRWLAFEPLAFDMEAMSQGDYTFTATIPEDLAEEEMAQLYFAFEEKASEADEKESEEGKDTPALPTMKVEQRVGVLITMAARETAKMKPMITKLLTRYTYTQDGTMDAYVTLSMANRGTAHAKPSGKIQIFKGDEVIDEKALGNVKAIFKNNSETYDIVFQGVAWPPDTYKAKALIGVKSYEDMWENLEEEYTFEIRKAEKAESEDEKNE